MWLLISGIAIAIGVRVDVGIVFVENMLRHFEMQDQEKMSKSEVLSLIYKSTIEVAPAVSTALATTIVSFLPVFFMEHAEGKLFKPLAFTKTFALGAAFVIGMVILPALSYYMFSFRLHREKIAKAWNISLMVAGIILAIVFKMWLPLVLGLTRVIVFFTTEN